MNSDPYLVLHLKINSKQTEDLSVKLVSWIYKGLLKRNNKTNSPNKNRQNIWLETQQRRHMDGK